MSQTEETIKEFIRLLLIEYDFEDISENELWSLWASRNKQSNPGMEEEPVRLLPSPVEIPEHVIKPITEDDIALLSKLKRVDLVKLCKTRSLPYSGTKDTLIGRLTGKMPVSKKRTKKKSSPKPVNRICILDTLTSLQKTIEISRNDFGNYEDRETGFVFDPEYKRVIGKQGRDGTIQPLSVDDINTCMELKYEFVLPPNLNIT